MLFVGLIYDIKYRLVKVMTIEVKRKRSPNMTDSERAVLSDLAIKYANVGLIECKRTDAVTVRLKELAWQQLADEFVALSSVRRDWISLKHVC
mgnify:CR=1 FL=1